MKGDSVHEITVRVPTKNIGYVLELTEGVNQGSKGMQLFRVEEGYSSAGKERVKRAPRTTGNGAKGSEVLFKAYPPGSSFMRPLAVQLIAKSGRSKSYAQQTISDLLRSGKIVKQLDGSYLVPSQEATNA